MLTSWSTVKCLLLLSTCLMDVPGSIALLVFAFGLGLLGMTVCGRFDWGVTGKHSENRPIFEISKSFSYPQTKRPLICSLLACWKALMRAAQGLSTGQTFGFNRFRLIFASEISGRLAVYNPRPNDHLSELSDHLLAFFCIRATTLTPGIWGCR